MNQALTEKHRKLYYKTPIVILTIISLFFTFFRFLSRILFGDSITIYSLVYLLLDVVSPIILLVYIFAFFKKFKATILVPIIFALLVVSPILSIVNYMEFYRRYDYWDFWYRITPLVTPLVPYIVQFIAFSLATISALKGLSNKILIVIPIGLLLLFDLKSFVSFFMYFFMYGESNLLKLYNEIASVTFNVALLLFGLKNRMPSVFSITSEKEKKKAGKLSPEQSLKLLKEELDLGMITEEEYQSQRSEIISKL